MRNTTQKTINKYMAMVATPGRIWTEQEIISFRSFINMKLSDQLDVRRAMMDRFYASLDIVPFQLTLEQQHKGLQWLIKTQINKKGELRNAQTTFLTDYDLEMVRNFENFEFVGLENIANNYQEQIGYAQYVPMYRLNASDGRWFTYGVHYDGHFQVFERNTTPRKSKRALKVVG